MKNALANAVRELSAILAGFKLSIILISYFGFGSLAKWIIEQWYPFTRWLWDNVFSYLHLPEISDIEKDALTAIVFFLPLGITAAISWFIGRSEDDNPRTKAISASLGLLFVYAICGNIISFVLKNAKINEKFVSIIAQTFSEYYGLFLFAVVLNAVSTIFLVRIWNRIHPRFPKSRYFRVLDKMLSAILPILSNPRRVFTL